MLHPSQYPIDVIRLIYKFLVSAVTLGIYLGG